MNPRTSQSHPLQIAVLDTPGGGRIGMTFCPGKRDPAAMTGPWMRDLDSDLAALVDWGTGALVTLMEGHELELLGVPALGDEARRRGLDWYHLPIRDASVPTPPCEAAWLSVGAALRERLRAGGFLVVHCRGGLGRTGLIAACLLIDLGEAPARALQRVRAARPGAVETRAQEAYVLGYRPLR